MSDQLPPDPMARVHAVNLAIGYYRDLAKTRLILDKRDDADLAVEIKPEIGEFLETADRIFDYIADGTVPDGPPAGEAT